MIAMVRLTKQTVIGQTDGMSTMMKMDSACMKMKIL